MQKKRKWDGIVMDKYNKNNLQEQLIDALNKFFIVVEDIAYKDAKILLMNPLELLDLPMESCPQNCYFISKIDQPLHSAIMLVEDSDEKKQAWDFIKKFPDRVFRGEKEDEKVVC